MISKSEKISWIIIDNYILIDFLSLKLTIVRFYNNTI